MAIKSVNLIVEFVLLISHPDDTVGTADYQIVIHLNLDVFYMP